MSIARYKKIYYLGGLVVALLGVPTALAAYERFAPGDTVTITEFVYDDDFVPTTTPCTLEVYEPDGDAFVLPGGNSMSVEAATGRHYKQFTPDIILGVWPATMSCGTAGVDLARLDKTFVVGYDNASTTDIAEAVWNQDGRTLSNFGSLVSDIWNVATSSLSTAGSVGKQLVDNLNATISGVASAVWSNTIRSLTSRQIGGGEYIAGVSADYLVTQVASDSQMTAMQSDVSDLITEIGSGNISAIRTKTDFINWDDITDLVTTSTAIRAKTDNINWSDITAIKTDTDTILWSDITAIKNKTDDIVWTDVTDLQGDVSDILTEIGSGNILSIRTKTDSINWSDITGLVATSSEIKIKTNTIDWTDVTAIKDVTDTITWTDIDDLMTEIGTGNITAIRTNTDVINWDDITGLVTTSTAIKAKTDLINWSDVTAIKTQTDLIDWSDITAIQTKTDSIVWTDITAIQGDVSDLITEIGTGNISAIRTKTDFINWDDITGLVATSSAIRVKTDSIDWTDVVAIQDVTDTITWTDINDIRTSQTAGWTVSLSDFGETTGGEAYKARLQVLDFETTPTDADSIPTVTIYDPEGTEQVSGAAMTRDSAGTYHYSYTVSGDADSGVWETKVSAVVDGKTVVVNDYWEVQGSPARVFINNITDTSVPTISANVTISNEGLSWYEYHYEWCVVTSESNECGGDDDVYYGTGSERIEALEDWNTNLTATVSSAGDYYFKLVVYFGTESSGASRSFTATGSSGPSCGDGSCNGTESCSSCPSDCGECPGGGGGGGGGGGAGSNTNTNEPPVITCDGADFNHDDKINSTDFSILLAFWKTDWPFANSCVDINGDQQVDSIDFSILMYQWDN